MRRGIVSLLHRADDTEPCSAVCVCDGVLKSPGYGEFDDLVVRGVNVSHGITSSTIASQ